MGITVEAIFAGILALGDLDQSNIELGVPIGCEGQDPGDMDGSNRLSPKRDRR